MSVSKLGNKPRHPHCKFNIQLHMPNVLWRLLQHSREQIQKDSYVPSGMSVLLAVCGHTELGFVSPLELLCCNPLGSGPQARSLAGVNQVALLQLKVLLQFMRLSYTSSWLEVPLAVTSRSIWSIKHQLRENACGRERGVMFRCLTIGATLTMSWISRWFEETKTLLEGI